MPFSILINQLDSNFITETNIKGIFFIKDNTIYVHQPFRFNRYFKWLNFQWKSGIVVYIHSNLQWIRTSVEKEEHNSINCMEICFGFHQKLACMLLGTTMCRVVHALNELERMKMNEFIKKQVLKFLFAKFQLPLDLARDTVISSILKYIP